MWSWVYGCSELTWKQERLSSFFTWNPSENTFRSSESGHPSQSKPLVGLVMLSEPNLKLITCSSFSLIVAVERSSAAKFLLFLTRFFFRLYFVHITFFLYFSHSISLWSYPSRRLFPSFKVILYRSTLSPSPLFVLLSDSVWSYRSTLLLLLLSFTQHFHFLPPSLSLSDSVWSYRSTLSLPLLPLTLHFT